MVEGEIRQRFIESAFLVDPLYLFESNHDSRTLSASLIAKCETLARGEKDELYRWIAGILADSSTYCFFGSSLILNSPKDVDMMLFAGAPGMIFFKKPKFIHVTDMNKSEGDMARDLGSFFFGSLLFPRMPPEFMLNTVEYCRQTAFSRPFFDGGYGEPLTHAAFKAIGREELFEPEDWEQVKHLKRFEIEYRYIDSGMMPHHYTVKSVHDQIRKKLCQLEEKEMRALAMAATRRIGVKSEHRSSVAEVFVAELKKLR